MTRLPHSLWRLDPNDRPKGTHIAVAMVASFGVVPLISWIWHSNTSYSSTRIWDYTFSGTYSFLVSWVGFLMLAAVFYGLTQKQLNGFIPTVLAGAVLGPIAMTLFAAVFFSDVIAISWGAPKFLIGTAMFGAIFSAFFWLFLLALQRCFGK